MVDPMFGKVPLYGFAGLLIVGALAQEAAAESMYRYVDQSGVIHFSNVPTDSRYETVKETAAPDEPAPPVSRAASLPSTEWDGTVQESIYQYVDKNGVTHFTNVPTSGRYRKVRGDRARGRLQPRKPSPALHQTITQTSRQYRLSPELVHAVIRAESAYDPQAVSSKGAMGLMQLMPKTASSLNVANPYDPEQNISGGVRYLRYLLDRFGGNLELALAAYNAGESRVIRENRIPRISETQQYVRRVLRSYRNLSRDPSAGRVARLDPEVAPLVTRRFINYLSPN